jgi:2-oxoglutarate ferredoxin oxidoreductase subunit beta
VEHPIRPVRAAIAAEATWVGRSSDTDTKHLSEMISLMAAHRGVSFLEVYQNCIIFNDKAFEDFAAKSVRDDRMLYLEPGKPLRFGKDREYGIRLNRLKPEKIQPGQNGFTDEDVMEHDATDPALAYLLATLDFPDFPVPVGVFFDVDRHTYEERLQYQVDQAKAKPGAGDLQSLLQGPNTWTVSD